MANALKHAPFKPKDPPTHNQDFQFPRKPTINFQENLQILKVGDKECTIAPPILVEDLTEIKKIGTLVEISMVVGSSMEEESNEFDALFVEVDPTGRYGRYKKILGRGAVKIVYWAFDKLEGKEVAWNQIKLRDVSRGYGDLERLYAEVHLLKTLKHENIIKFYNYWMDDKSNNINIITEIFTSGTLRQYRKRHKQVDVRAIKNWSRQILQGLLYLHSQDPPIIHRDLKCDNIFVNGGQGEVKIGDLGMAAILHETHADSIIGTPEFMAPELYEEKYNELVDIYSFGMCLLEMMTFEYPYCECKNAVQIYKKVTSGVKPAALKNVRDPSVRQFIEKCLANAPERLSARELLMDPFLQNEGESEIMNENQFPSLRNSFKEHKTISEDLHMRGSFRKLSPRSEQEHSFRRSFKTVEEQLAFNSNAIMEASMHQEPVDVENILDDYMQTGGNTSSCKDESQGHRDIQVKGARKDANTIFLKLQIADSEGNVRNIHFPFDVEADTAMIVASEMVAELDLSDHDVTTIAEMMDVEIAALVPEWKPGVSCDDLSDDHSLVISKGNYSDIASDDDYLSGEFRLERLPSGRKYWLQSPVPIGGKSSGKTAPLNFADSEHQPCSDNTTFPTKSDLQGLVPNILDARDHVKHPTHSEMMGFPGIIPKVSKEQGHSHEIVKSEILAEAKNPPVSLQVDETTHESPAVPSLEETGIPKDLLLEENIRIAWEVEKLTKQQQYELETLKRKHEQALQGLKNQLRLKGCNGRNCFSEASELQQKLSIDRKLYECKSERLSLAEITVATAMVRSIEGPEMHHKKSWDDSCISGHNFGVQDLSPSFKSDHLSGFGVDFNTRESFPSNGVFTQQLPDLTPKHGGCETRSSFSAADQTHRDGISSKNDTVETRKSNGPSTREEDLSVPQGKSKISSNSFSRTYSLGPHFSKKSSDKTFTDIECKDAIMESVKNGTMGLASKDESNTNHLTHSEKELLASERKQHASVQSHKISQASLADLLKMERENWKLERYKKKVAKQDTAGTQAKSSDPLIKESVPSLENVFSVVDKQGKPKSNMKVYKNGFSHKDEPRLNKKDRDGSEQCSSKKVPSKLPKSKGDDKVYYQEKRQPSEKVSPVKAVTAEELNRSKSSNLTSYSVKKSFYVPRQISSGLKYKKI